MNNTIYSANIRLGGPGMGTSVLEIVRGLHAAHLIQQVLVSSVSTTEFPAGLIASQGWLGRQYKRLGFLEPSGRADYWVNRQFDRWVSRHMRSAPVFTSWTGFCLTSLQTARRRGMRTVLNHGSAHPRTQLELIQNEHRRLGLRPPAEGPMVRLVERELECADILLVQSNYSRNSLLEHGVSAGKIHVLPLGVNLGRFQPPAERSLDPFRVLFMGQVSLRKGVQYLLEAWRQLRWPDAELWIAGQILPEARELVRRSGGLPGVRWLGQSDTPQALFQACHVFVLPSVEDGFGLVVTEAMACGLPVVVSDHTGAADLVTDGQNGLVIAYNDTPGYAQALETLRRQPELRAHMGQAGQVVARQQTWDHYRQKLAGLYRALPG